MAWRSYALPDGKHRIPLPILRLCLSIAANGTVMPLPPLSFRHRHVLLQEWRHGLPESHLPAEPMECKVFLLRPCEKEVPL